VDRSRLLLFLPRWLLFILWGVVVSWLSLVPSPPVINSGFFGWDKFQHAASYGVFTLLAGWAFGYSPTDMKHRWLRAAALAVLFGGLIEVAQGVLTKTRTAELADFFADLVGAVVVYCAVMVVASCRKR
jgi:VanZ family protein